MLKLKKERVIILFLLMLFSRADAYDLSKILKHNYNKYYSLDGYNAEGKAKVYSQYYNNKQTASGMKFSHYAHTAASVKLPLMSVVKVTNKGNGKSVYVLINDRGPYKTNAVIDLSRATVSLLNYRSSDQVILEFDMNKTLQLANNASEVKKFTCKL